MKQSGKKNVCRLQTGAPADLSSAHICRDCLETLRYLNGNQYYMCQAFTTRNKHQETWANQTSSLCLRHRLNLRGVLIAQTNHRRVKLITEKDILFFLPVIIQEQEGSPVRWVPDVRWEAPCTGGYLLTCQRREKTDLPSAVKPVSLRVGETWTSSQTSCKFSHLQALHLTPCSGTWKERAVHPQGPCTLWSPPRFFTLRK